jgi:hypothetical protein
MRITGIRLPIRRQAKPCMGQIEVPSASSRQPSKSGAFARIPSLSVKVHLLLWKRNDTPSLRPIQGEPLRRRAGAPPKGAMPAGAWRAIQRSPIDPMPNTSPRHYVPGDRAFPRSWLFGHRERRPLNGGPVGPSRFQFDNGALMLKAALFSRLSERGQHQRKEAPAITTAGHKLSAPDCSYGRPSGRSSDDGQFRCCTPGIDARIRSEIDNMFEAKRMLSPVEAVS